MKNEFINDIKLMTSIASNFWAIEESLILGELQKMKYNINYGEYLSYHNVVFLNVSLGYTVSFNINGEYVSKHITMLGEYIFSTTLLRMYTIHQVVQ